MQESGPRCASVSSKAGGPGARRRSDTRPASHYATPARWIRGKALRPLQTARRDMTTACGVRSLAQPMAAAGLLKHRDAAPAEEAAWAPVKRGGMREATGASAQRPRSSSAGASDAMASVVERRLGRQHGGLALVQGEAASSSNVGNVACAKGVKGKDLQWRPWWSPRSCQMLTRSSLRHRVDRALQHGPAWKSQ